MVLGDRGDSVKELQRQLNDAGASPALVIDGIWGPKTQAAYEELGEQIEVVEDPADTTTPATSEPGQDYTPDNAAGRFNVIGGNPEIWLNQTSGKYLVVYFVPDSEPPLPIYWEVPDEQTLQAYFGPDIPIIADKTTTDAALVSYGALGQGFSTEIPVTDQDPILGWAEIYERQASVRPYLNDPEVVGLIMGAAIEGRSVTQAELESTQWWQTHTEGEREWLIKVEADPKSAQQIIGGNRSRVLNDLAAAGMNNPPDSLVDFMTTQFTTGLWNENQLISQIAATTDPASIHAMLPETQAALNALGMPVDQTMQEEDTVRDMLNKWLGPQYGAWEDDAIAAKAGELRNDPDAKIMFEEQLKQQRLAMFPGYEDENLSYQDIATPWRNFGLSQWGEQMDEMDPMFSQMLTNNDAIENGKLLTREGMKRGVGKVTTDLSAQINRATGGSVQEGR